MDADKNRKLVDAALAAITVLTGPSPTPEQEKAADKLRQIVCTGLQASLSSLREVEAKLYWAGKSVDDTLAGLAQIDAQ